MSEPTETPQTESRLRPHPETRFAPPQVQVDINAVAARLRSEKPAGERGHRQETLYKSGGLTIALFVFERFTGLPEHQTAGVVNMHLLNGRLKITADNQIHELAAGQMLALASGIRHTVAAEEESEMLVTVRLADGQAPAARSVPNAESRPATQPASAAPHPDPASSHPAPRINYVHVAPDAIKAMRGLEQYVRQSGLETSLLELVRLRASQINGCGYCIDMHTKDARAAGESEQRLYTLSVWEETGFFTDREKAAMAWTEAVTQISQDHVPDEVYHLARQQFSEKELVDLTMAAIAINGWNRLAIPFRTVPGTYHPPSRH